MNPGCPEDQEVKHLMSTQDAGHEYGPVDQVEHGPDAVGNSTEHNRQ